MEDSEIIKLFISREERAVAEVREKYGGICKSIAFSMLHNSEDAEECVSDVYIALWNAIPPVPDNLKAYACRITRNMCLKNLEYNSAGKRNAKLEIPLSDLEDSLGGENIEGDMENAEIGEAISRFLRSQKPDERNVFMRRYWLTESIKEIAERYQFSESKVKSMLFRTRSRLKKFLTKEGIDL